jgi:hypothetical protein
MTRASLLEHLANAAEYDLVSGIVFLSAVGTNLASGRNTQTKQYSDGVLFQRDLAL